uniref:Uncharacterized protein MANES_09G064700 n=1 Tax=Rhizophora mucronata TaxID=61149 RepID=A0A2P2JTX0_RHIMU
METNGALSDSHENGCLECSNNSNKESSIEKEVFVNHAKMTWNERRKQWVGDSSQRSKRIPRESIMRYIIHFYYQYTCASHFALLSSGWASIMFTCVLKVFICCSRWIFINPPLGNLSMALLFSAAFGIEKKILENLSMLCEETWTKFHEVAKAVLKLNCEYLI